MDVCGICAVHKCSVLDSFGSRHLARLLTDSDIKLATYMKGIKMSGK